MVEDDKKDVSEVEGSDSMTSSPSVPDAAEKQAAKLRPPEERLADHEQSTVDAMGKEKRRQIIGGTYGPTVQKQLIVWGSVVAVLFVLVLASIFVVSKVDNREIERAEAPWKDNPSLAEPTSVDFPPNGPQPERSTGQASDPESGAVPEPQTQR